MFRFVQVVSCEEQAGWTKTYEEEEFEYWGPSTGHRHAGSVGWTAWPDEGPEC